MKHIKPFARASLFRTYVLLHRYLHRKGILPISRNFGAERGTPIGRYYVEKFLNANQEYVKGRCLEFGDACYRGLFPGAENYQVLNIEAGPGVDYICDIHDVKDMPAAAFDAIICVQVFEHLAFPEVAAESLYDLLVPGGVLLLTAPFINPVHYVPTDYRRFTPECIEMMLENAGLSVDSVDVEGSSLVGTGCLLGLVQEDFTRQELDVKDPVYPYSVLVRAHRPA